MTTKTLLIFFTLLLTHLSFAQIDYPAFDRGPDPKDPMQAELIQIVKDMPYLPGISEQLQVLVPSYKKGQKMRPDFGAMPLRGFLIPNSISVLVIGQDGTHIAEGANRPGIAGFGGRVHDMLKHFGILEGVFFTNLYVNTISGQYGSRNTPVIKNNKKLEYRNVIENRQWLMTHEGPYGKWRNRFISWVVRNNLKSLKMVMMLGQAGKDAGANFINFIGGKVTARKNIGNGSQFSVPWFEMVGAGGNNEWAVPITQDGKDVAELLRREEKIRTKLITKLETKMANTSDEKKIKLLKKRIKALNAPLNYKDGGRDGSLVSAANAQDLLSDNLTKAKELMVFSNGGPMGNGVLYPEQFGGWDLKTMKVKGKRTRSIKGLKVPCLGSDAGPCRGGRISVTAPDIVFVGAPHPTSLSMGEMSKRGSAAIKVEKELLRPLKAEVKRGWNPPLPEKGLSSPFLEGKPYQYGRGIIPESHGDPGITDLRLLPVSTAKRQGRSVIVIGTRGSANFDKKKIKAMEKALPTNRALLDEHTVLTGRPKIDSWLTQYDRGPELKYASLLFRTIDKKKVFAVKAEYNPLSEKLSSKAKRKVFDQFGIDAFYAKTHFDAGLFGHYRGTFNNPKVIILADPHGVDSFITSKAATGKRGQYLNGLMKDLGIDNQYLVINTVPFGMDNAHDDEWNYILKQTESYRTNIIEELKKDFPGAVFVADGKYSALELKRILKDSKYITIPRGEEADSVIAQAGRQMSKMKKFKGAKISGRPSDIPREHLTWIARTWEGTSGDRVITATDKKNKGKAFAIVAPNWARKNEIHFTEETRQGIFEMVQKLIEAGEPRPGENLKSFLNRK